MVAEMLKAFEEVWKRSLSGDYSRENDELIRYLALQISTTYIPKFLIFKFPTAVKHANAFALYAKSL